MGRKSTRGSLTSILEMKKHMLGRHDDYFARFISLYTGSFAFFVWYLQDDALVNQSSILIPKTHIVVSEQPRIGPCAINLYGLPRQFQNVALPGLIRNVVQTNAPYECDYFVHFHNLRQETLSRGIDQGRSGSIHPEEVLMLRDVVRRETTRESVVRFANTTEVEFRQRYDSLLNKILNTEGPVSYRPRSDSSYTNETLENVIKMWHGQQSVWELMETTATAMNRHYSRVAMLRLDVLYVTPIDIYALPNSNIPDFDNSKGVIPKFSSIPVNDRLFYGPYDAARLWANGRFSRLERHIRLPIVTKMGDGIHSEKFLFRTIFPAIDDYGLDTLKDPRMCFLRIRPDTSIRFSDCGLSTANKRNQEYLESLIGVRCTNTSGLEVMILECGAGQSAVRGGRGNYWEMAQ